MHCDPSLPSAAGPAAMTTAGQTWVKGGRRRCGDHVKGRARRLTAAQATGSDCGLRRLRPTPTGWTLRPPIRHAHAISAGRQPHRIAAASAKQQRSAAARRARQKRTRRPRLPDRRHPASPQPDRARKIKDNRQQKIPTGLTGHTAPHHRAARLALPMCQTMQRIGRTRCRS